MSTDNGPTPKRAPWSAPWSASEYWQGRFASGDTPWELSHPSSVLIEALGELVSRGFSLQGAKVISPGCGGGEDALELVRCGAQVIAIDWSHEALKRISEKVAALDEASRARISILEGDVFAVVPYGVDLVAEHTFFCAIDPSQRATYAHTMASIIKPGGYLFGNFFVLAEDDYRTLAGASLSSQGGPPFATTERELRALFQSQFRTVVLRPATDPAPERRPGMEWVGLFERVSGTPLRS
jgi:hypothetical protein